MDDRFKQIAQHVETIDIALSELRRLTNDVAGLPFEHVRGDFERLERAFTYKTTIDAAFAYIAERDDAGRAVHSSRARDYLQKKLGLSYGEAMDRLRAGHRLFGPAPEAEPAPTDLEQHKSESEQRDKERRAAERRAKEKERRERKAQEELRRKLGEEEAARAEVLRIIEHELTHLNRFALPGHNELYNLALEQAKSRSPEQVRQWLRARIREANNAMRSTRGAKDPHAATRKRYLTVSRPDADGGVRVEGYLDAAAAAVLSKALSPATRPGGPDLPEAEDTRSYRQRMADQLTAIAAQFMESKGTSSGLGSIVVSATTDELSGITSETRFPTDTGHMLSAADIVRLGAAATDYLCIMDESSFLPLALGRSKRSASLAQRIALAASELVCSSPGCDRPAKDCDVHHVYAWHHGGATDLNNLTLRCREHHVDNNDNRDFANNMGHAERDPITGRVGTRWPGSTRPELNYSEAARQSASEKLRARGTVRYGPLKKEAQRGTEDPPGRRNGREDGQEITLKQAG